MFPDFIIIGPPKCASTSLHNYLGQHPEVYTTKVKETRFFSLNYHKGMDFYAEYFKDAGDAKAIGEATPSYCFLPFVADRIKQHFPDIKLVLCFRNPTDRTFSSWLMQKGMGKEKLSLREAVDINLKQMEYITLEGEEGEKTWMGSTGNFNAAQAAHQAAHEWKPVDFREVGQSRWLIIGFGNIGREIAARAKAFGAHVEAVRRSAGAEGLADAVSTIADLPSRLPQADVVVLACALNDETRDLANAGFFAAMKPGSILINIGRGGLLDEDALRVSLDADRPGHAVLDVFKTEPLPADSWIWDHPKIRVTPHASNRGALTGARGEALFLENLGRYVRGEPLLNPVNPADIGVG